MTSAERSCQQRRGRAVKDKLYTHRRARRDSRFWGSLCGQEVTFRMSSRMNAVNCPKCIAIYKRRAARIRMTRENFHKMLKALKIIAPENEVAAKVLRQIQPQTLEEKIPAEEAK